MEKLGCREDKWLLYCSRFSLAAGRVFRSGVFVVGFGLGVELSFFGLF